ncbi:MAG: hypothetical protein ACXVED_17600, partial [Bacteroidia bacterium]
MKKALAIPLILLCFTAFGQKIDRAAFYKVMSSVNIDEINNFITVCKRNGVTAEEGYLGALLMKKAQLVSSKKEKLDLFKDGHSKLEHTIAKDTSKTEFRFLRLMIEEHAPRFLGYHFDIEKDGLYIRNHYNQLPAEVKHFIIN